MKYDTKAEHYQFIIEGTGGTALKDDIPPARF
jgi:hypothetical protein